jgi:hypothetical protein
MGHPAKKFCPEHYKKLIEVDCVTLFQKKQKDEISITCYQIYRKDTEKLTNCVSPCASSFEQVVAVYS